MTEEDMLKAAINASLQGQSHSSVIRMVECKKKKHIFQFLISAKITTEN